MASCPAFLLCFCSLRTAGCRMWRFSVLGQVEVRRFFFVAFGPLSLFNAVEQGERAVNEVPCVDYFVYGHCSPVCKSPSLASAPSDRPLLVRHSMIWDEMVPARSSIRAARHLDADEPFAYLYSKTEQPRGAAEHTPNSATLAPSHLVKWRSTAS